MLLNSAGSLLELTGVRMNKLQPSDDVENPS